jgi:hypothetical protein
VSVCWECRVLLGRCLCVGLNIRPEESYWAFSVWAWSWSFGNEKTLTHYGLLRHGGKICCWYSVEIFKRVHISWQRFYMFASPNLSYYPRIYFWDLRKTTQPRTLGNASNDFYTWRRGNTLCVPFLQQWRHCAASGRANWRLERHGAGLQKRRRPVCANIEGENSERRVASRCSAGDAAR